MLNSKAAYSLLQVKHEVLSLTAHPDEACDEIGPVLRPTRRCEVEHIRALREKTIATGVLKSLNGQKGFGFIQLDHGGNDVFAHISAVERAGVIGLGEGQKLSYGLKTDKIRGKSSAEKFELV